MLAVGRMLILTHMNYGPRAYYVHWYCGYSWDTCRSTTGKQVIKKFSGMVLDVEVDQVRYEEACVE